MSKPACYEFEAIIAKDGSYECRELPTPFFPEPATGKLQSSNSKPELKGNNQAHMDVNKVFFESYNSNFTMSNNELLKQAQKNLVEMQKIILANLKL